MSGRASLNATLVKFLQLLCLLWFVALLVGLIDRDVLQWPEDYWYPLFLRTARFTDLTIFQVRFTYFHQRAFFDLAGFPFTYPAPVALVYEAFYRFGSYALQAYIGCSVLVFAGAGLIFGRVIYRRGLAIWPAILFVSVSFLLSYPFWFLLDRANIEIVNWLLLALGIAAYWNKRWYIAATFFGAAVSFKIFPFVFFGLLLSDRKYRAIVWGLIVCAVSTIVSTWIIGPTYPIASKGIAKGLEFFKANYVLQVHRFEIGFDHSLFAIVKELIFRHKAPESHYLASLNTYLFIATAAGCVLYFWKIRRLPRANQILALTVVSVLLPPVSGDYTLVHLYFPWAVLVLVSLSQGGAHKVPGLTFCFGCMAFLMAPESYFYVHGIRVAGQLKAVALVLLLIGSLRFAFEEGASNGDQVAET